MIRSFFVPCREMHGVSFFEQGAFLKERVPKKLPGLFHAMMVLSFNDEDTPCYFKTSLSFFSISSPLRLFPIIIPFGSTNRVAGMALMP